MTNPSEEWIAKFNAWLAANPTPAPEPPEPEPPSAYDTAVLADHPVLFLSSLVDAGSGAHPVKAVGEVGSAVLPNGDAAFLFTGANYLEIADADDLSIPTTRKLTIEAWLQPSTLQFPHDEGTGYVHWMGKGEPNKHEWVSRMYSKTNEENRPNRISGYAFNASGGIGNGSYFQDPVRVGEWIFYTLVLTTVSSSKYPKGYVKIYKNGVQRDQDALDISGGADITPAAGNAPMRVGTRDKGSYFEGAIGKVAVFGTELSTAQIAAHYNAMERSG